MEGIRKNLPSAFFAAGTVSAIILSGIEPPAGTDVWLAEIVWSALYCLFLIFAFFAKIRFSVTAYSLAALWCVLQAVGAHYSFEHVPAFDGLFGFERNHFDRLAHFSIGLNALLVCEFLFDKKIVFSRTAAGVLGFFVIVAVAGIWEIVEWIYAVVDGGETGAAFLGSQGDVWDAQKDMLSDALGGITAGIFFIFRRERREDNPEC